MSRASCNSRVRSLFSKIKPVEIKSVFLSFLNIQQIGLKWLWRESIDMLVDGKLTTNFIMAFD